ncbi:MAG: zinc dependent phospholipase C family protein [Sedimentisphaerales bacterium]|nr:zinc dependent phospholipase C family protein [Sedimentisphaerales bacterium]
MPASVAHMLIAHKGLKKLQVSEDAGLAEFGGMLDSGSGSERYQAYMNVGSIGPDLYYFKRPIKGIFKIFKDGYVQAEGVTPWSYHLHSNRPNEFPLKLIQIVFSDAEREGGKAKFGVNDIRKLAYIAGHLSHIAADQIVRPLVNSIAGPYYTSGENRDTHREAEVYQDYFLYQEVYRLEDKSGPRYEFFKQDFRKWVDCIDGLRLRNTHDWFRYFLQRGFIETYGTGPDESTIENSVDGVLVTLAASKIAGPYKKADREYKKEGRDGPLFQKYVGAPRYLKYYGQAVELTEIYMSALYKVYRLLTDGGDFNEKRKMWFCNVVSGADLSCPLEEGILEKARAELANWV